MNGLYWAAAWASILSLIVTVFGFGATLYNLWSTGRQFTSSMNQFSTLIGLSTEVRDSWKATSNQLQQNSLNMNSLGQELVSAMKKITESYNQIDRKLDRIIKKQQ